MSLFSKYSAPGNGHRLTGMARFTELLDRDFKKMMFTNLLTVIGFLPLIIGIVFSILSSSILVLIPVCVIGGCFAGCALSAMYDTIFRILRDAPGKAWDNYRHALRQNWRQSLIPGIILALLLGFYSFMAAMMLWAAALPGFGTILIYLVGLFLILGISTIYWPQLVLFEQGTAQRIGNCILFSIRYFWKLLGCTILKLAYWLAFALFLPWSFVLLPLTGFWFILFLTDFLLYDSFNQAFGIEEKIAEAFPEQTPFYEDDATWLERKRNDQGQ